MSTQGIQARASLAHEHQDREDHGPDKQASNGTGRAPEDELRSRAQATEIRGALLGS